MVVTAKQLDTDESREFRESQSDSGWHASLKLGFRATPIKTLLSEREHVGPLRVQRPFYPEGECCHVYLLHPPGGVAGGDSLDISVSSHKGSRGLITTPGATKFYHSIGPAAQVRQTFDIAGELEWLPQENILFPGANVDMLTRINLQGDARFIGWEINCLGRPVIDEPFDQGEATFRFQLLRDGLPILHERMVINGEAGHDSSLGLHSPVGLRGQAVFASLYATVDDIDDNTSGDESSGHQSLMDALRNALPDQHKTEVGITHVDGLLIARYLGNSTETAIKLFTSLWKIIRPQVLKRPACEPRIWRT